MKRITKFFALAIGMIAISASTFAQVSATATASATIITPIAISNTGNMDFGSMAVNATPGTVIIDPATSTRAAAGGVTLVGATVTRSNFFSYRTCWCCFHHFTSSHSNYYRWNQ